MGYYIRVLGTENPDIDVDELLDSLQADGLKANFALLQGETPGKWTQLQVANEKGETIIQVERNPVTEGELGFDELEEFKEEIEDFKPASAVSWLQGFFKKVKVIYAFQLLNSAFDDNNYPIVSSIRSKIWNTTGGILQADNEGFSNEDGYHILWQFSDEVDGPWSCAVLTAFGQWQRFQMDLADEKQRADFMAGRVPAGAKKL